MNKIKDQFIVMSKESAEKIFVGDNVLRRRQIVFECPPDGPGAGRGKIKMGDGETDYKDLPYFME